MHTTIDQINQQIADSFGVEVTEIQADYDLRQDFNASELEFADLISLLEYEFSIEIPTDEARQLVTVADLHELILDKLNEVS